MPIYEFKCSKCDNFFELLVMSRDDQRQLRCPECRSEAFERVLSTTNYAFSQGGGKQTGAKAQTRTCSGGSCTTYELPGPTR